MAKRIIHRNKRSYNSKPVGNGDTTYASSTSNFIRNSNYQQIEVGVEDGLYLNGVLYVGIAYITPDGSYVTLDTRYSTPRFINLISRGLDEQSVIESRKTLSRKNKAKLVQTPIRNILKDRRIEDIIRGRGKQNISATKTIKRSFNKRG